VSLFEASAGEIAMAGRSGAGPGCLAIAASTGGIGALATFFGALGPGIGVPILITQHLPPAFMCHFARQIEGLSRRRSTVAEPGIVLRPDEILIAPGDAHLCIVRVGEEVRVHLDHRAAPSGCMPSADPMFAALAATYGANGVAVLLSGMGRDGLEGAQAVAAAGGEVMAQDRDSSVVWGMPGAVVGAGIASIVLPPDRLAVRITDRQRAPKWS
jgi:two-component system chemotaxis response regulator CheB